jgi:cellobiose epimerase
MQEKTIINRYEFKRQLRNELTNNILPFWSTRLVDRLNGGFYGAITNDNMILNEVPRSSVLCARILWTFSAAYRKLGTAEYLETAQWAYDTLRESFWDGKHGGVYWSVEKSGTPVMDRKHHYAQAFAIYGLVEYYRTVRDPESLRLAQVLFQLLEKYAHEPVHGGYLEGSTCDWQPLEDMRLSEKDLNCRKSMNTLLHILEAYTNLLRVWEVAGLRMQHRALIEIFLDKVIDARTGHLKLFFDDPWNSLSENISFGHDIEASWLLYEASMMHTDTALRERVRAASIQMAEAVLREGRDVDNSIFQERGPEGLTEADKEWWTQAEAVVGFYNAHRLTGEIAYAEASRATWEFIRGKLIDRTNGDWFKRLGKDGKPDLASYKAGPWECPYHHGRMGLEMIERL